MSKQMSNSAKRRVTVYSVGFVFVFLLSLLFPYSGDDWAWGSQIGLDCLAAHFEAYNGRYVGNLIVLAMTRSNVLKALCMSLFIIAMLYMIEKIVGNRTAPLIASAALLLMPTDMLRQSIVWTSGFSNYATSIALTLVFVCYTARIYGKTAPKFAPAAAIPLFALAFCGALIMEPITIYNILLGIYIIIYCLVRFKKCYFAHFGFLAGAIAGAGMMFSNSSYHAIAEGADGYRTVSTSIGGLISRAFENVLSITKDLFLASAVLNIFVLIACVLLWITFKDKINGKARLVFGYISMAVIIGFCVWSLASLIGAVNYPKIFKMLNAALSVVYYLAIGIFILAVPCKGTAKSRLLFWYVSVPATLAPLLIVTPIGSRCEFAAYVLMICLAADMYSLTKAATVKKVQLPVRRVLVSVTAFSMLFLFGVFGTVTFYNQRRVSRAREELKTGAETITVENLPFAQYVWTPNPIKDTVWETRFKLFYGLGDETVRIKNVKNGMWSNK